MCPIKNYYLNTTSNNNTCVECVANSTVASNGSSCECKTYVLNWQPNNTCICGDNEFYDGSEC
jgi:hypothetical protein